MKITAGNLGMIPYALQTSFNDLGFEMILPPLTNFTAQEYGEKNLET